MAVTRATLDSIFGNSNVTLWADRSNNRDEAEIQSQVDYAINLATEEVKAKLRLLTYDVDEAIVLPLVEHAIGQRAGDILYAPRAVSDVSAPGADVLKIHRQQYQDFFRKLSSNQMDLGIDRACRPYPAVGADEVDTGSCQY